MIIRVGSPVVCISMQVIGLFCPDVRLCMISMAEALGVRSRSQIVSFHHSRYSQDPRGPANDTHRR